MGSAFSSLRRRAKKSQISLSQSNFFIEMNLFPKNNVIAEHPEVVRQGFETLKEYVEKGRSTPGPKADNHEGRNWWKLLPWDENGEPTFDWQ